jgi:demethylspheroidene O-methyltransferase
MPAGSTDWSGWIERLVARPDIQARITRTPLLRRFARREGAEIFDLIQGFVRSQVLFALVDLGILERLGRGPLTPRAIALSADLTEARAELILRAGVGIGVLKAARGGAFALSRKGAALSGVPGLTDMILHHRAFYADMADPAALLRGERDTNLAAFWPYVHGAGAAGDDETARRYSDLMARSQVLVAEDTLATVSLDGLGSLLDVGGGTGAFLTAVGARYRDLGLRLFDLPAVAPLARRSMAAAGFSDRFVAYAGSFRDDPLPTGADAISLVRVLYDHDDDTVRALLSRVRETLPPGGRLIISEPMSGGARPDPATDVYFAFYTLAMKTGRTRSQAEIVALCRDAGFVNVRAHKPFRSFITSVVEACTAD